MTFKVEEPQWMPPVIEILEFVIEEKMEDNELSWIQKKVCKWFKINPERKFRFQIKAHFDVDGHMNLHYGDTLIDKLGCYWTVLTIDGDQMQLASIKPYTICSPSGSVAVLFRAFPETQQTFKYEQ